ncbi:DnaB-like helicase N-terminal domain-containing protein [Paraburkholderia terrae]|uniref:DnaB-like helicase N-terminal domain-containing protein n=1 Tax=Paraburkholderia terrae TaxID=311230 RepID=UPI0005AAAD61|nr:DnaB-like helicase N-terminal domain-containing protein [Paraburkholderia terrae]
MNYENDLQTRGEQRVLACLLQRNEALCHCMNLTPCHFSHDQHGMIFRAIRALLSQGRVADEWSVFAFLREVYPRYHVSSVYLIALRHMAVHTSNCGYYASKLQHAGDRP